MVRTWFPSRLLLEYKAIRRLPAYLFTGIGGACGCLIGLLKGISIGYLVNFELFGFGLGHCLFLRFLELFLKVFDGLLH